MIDVKALTAVGQSELDTVKTIRSSDSEPITGSQLLLNPSDHSSISTKWRLFCR